MTDPSGPEVAPVNLSARQAKEKGLLTSGTCGRHGSISSASADLGSFSVSKLKATTASLGSTLFGLTWKRRDTPSGRSFCLLRASARRTPDTGYSSWPSPQASDGTGGGQAKRATNPERSNDLNDFVLLAAWPTPRASEIGRIRSEEAITRAKQKGGSSSLEDTVQLIVPIAAEPVIAPNASALESPIREPDTLAMPAREPGNAENAMELASWNTPRATDGSKGGPNQSGGALPADAVLASWATPTARDSKGANRRGFKDRSDSRKGEQLANQVVHEGPLTASGPMPNGSPAATEKPGQLNPALSRWLMALPEAWDEAAIHAWRLMPTRREKRES